MQTLDDFLFERLAKDNIKRTSQGFTSYCPFPWHPQPRHEHYHFHISVKKGVVKCFSCGTFMSLFNFLTWAGAPWELSVKYLFSSEEWGKQEKILSEKDLVLGYYIPKSMLERGFTEETLDFFEVGYDKLKKSMTIPLYFENVLVGVAFRRYPKAFSYSKNFSRRFFIYNYEPSEERYYVEGFTDTWRVWQNGTKNVSATLGVNVTKEQIDLMRKHKKVFLAFDKDYPGLLWSFFLYEKLKRDVEVFYVDFNCPDKAGKIDAGNCEKIQWENRQEVDFFDFKIQLLQSMPDLYKKIQKDLKKLI